MVAFWGLPCVAAAVWSVHAGLLIARRREEWIGFCVLLIGLPVTAFVCFARSQAEHAAYVRLTVSTDSAAASSPCCSLLRLLECGLCWQPRRSFSAWPFRRRRAAAMPHFRNHASLWHCLNLKHRVR